MKLKSYQEKNLRIIYDIIYKCVTFYQQINSEQGFEN